MKPSRERQPRSISFTCSGIDTEPRDGMGRSVSERVSARVFSSLRFGAQFKISHHAIIRSRSIGEIWIISFGQGKSRCFRRQRSHVRIVSGASTPTPNLQKAPGVCFRTCKFAHHRFQHRLASASVRASRGRSAMSLSGTFGRIVALVGAVAILFRRREGRTGTRRSRWRAGSTISASVGAAPRPTRSSSPVLGAIWIPGSSRWCVA
jgi:hypothetical protein